jgi:hypothetical protein
MAKGKNPWLLLQCKQHGIDPRTGLRIDARGSDEPRNARAAIDMTTEPAEQDKPATGIVEADERDDPDERDHDSLSPEGDVQVLPVALR